MNLSNRIYTRKVFYRIVYMFNFYKSILSKNIYLDLADKIDNIVKHGLDKLSPEDFLKYDFSKLLVYKKFSSVNNFDIKYYLNNFNPDSKEFLDLIDYVKNNIVKSRQDSSLEMDYIFSCMSYLYDNYNLIVSDIDLYLPKFKFYELDSITQSILILVYVESKKFLTHKNILIKEALFLADTFDSDNSGKLINAVLDKVL